MLIKETILVSRAGSGPDLLSFEPARVLAFKLELSQGFTNLAINPNKPGFYEATLEPLGSFGR